MSVVDNIGIIGSLIDQLEEKKERIRQLERLLGLGNPAPLIFRFSKTESALFGVLMARKVVSRETAMQALYGDDSCDPPGDQVIPQYIHRIRKRLRLHGITVSTAWGNGWYIDEASKDLARRMIEQSVVA